MIKGKTQQRQDMLDIARANLEVATQLLDVSKKLHDKKQQPLADETLELANQLLENTAEMHNLVGELDNGK